MTAPKMRAYGDLMDDVHLSKARHFRYELRLGGKFSAAIWSAGGVPRITNGQQLTMGLSNGPSIKSKKSPVRPSTISIILQSNTRD